MDILFCSMINVYNTNRASIHLAFDFSRATTWARINLYIFLVFFSAFTFSANGPDSVRTENIYALNAKLLSLFRHEKLLKINFLFFSFRIVFAQEYYVNDLRFYVMQFLLCRILIFFLLFLSFTIHVRFALYMIVQIVHLFFTILQKIPKNCRPCHMVVLGKTESKSSRFNVIYGRIYMFCSSL